MHRLLARKVSPELAFGVIGAILAIWVGSAVWAYLSYRPYRAGLRTAVQSCAQAYYKKTSTWPQTLGQMAPCLSTRGIDPSEVTLVLADVAADGSGANYSLQQQGRSGTLQVLVNR